jgi:two-component system OmpR family response regulator
MNVVLFLPHNQDKRRIVQALTGANYTVREVRSFEECMRLARAKHIGAFIFDSDSLPFFDALTLVTFVRESPQATIFIVAHHLDPQQRLRLFEAGVDDLVDEPLFVSELLVRLCRSIRLRQAASNHLTSHEVSLLRCGELELDLVRRTVRRSGQLIDLRPKEFALLECLARNMNRPLTRTELMEDLCCSASQGDSNVVDVHINSLRNKIDRCFPSKLIHTTRGVGYSLVVPAEPSWRRTRMQKQ